MLPSGLLDTALTGINSSTRVKRPTEQEYSSGSLAHALNPATAESR